MMETQQEDVEREITSPEAGGPAADSPPLTLKSLKSLGIQQLFALAEQLGLGDAAGSRRHELIFRLLRHETKTRGMSRAEGVLEVMPEGYGFLRAPESNY